jgi:ribbon-helix-helix CopG family protein
MVKVTFTVDEDTVRTLRETAERLGKPQSLVVREAVAEYAARAGQLTESERRHTLKVLDAIARETPRPASSIRAEIRSIRAARRASGRRRP